MNLNDIINRQPVPQPWAEGEKIPWNDAGFSRRMLQEHLSQQHDAASRRFSIIDRHVDWINRVVLGASPARILDLGCGPGLYAIRLARLGHTCTGIDFSPASIEYARHEAEQAGLPIDYRLEDIRQADYGRDYDLVMLIFGEFNVFSPADAGLILAKAAAALRPGGQLLLEISTYSSIRGIGHSGPTWSAYQRGLFLDRPHLLLYESFWDESQGVATERWFVLDAATLDVTACAASNQAYRQPRLRSMLAHAGFDTVRAVPSLAGEKIPSGAGFSVLLAQVSVERVKRLTK